MKHIVLLLASALCLGAATAQMQSFLRGYDACLAAQGPPAPWLSNWRLHCKDLYNRTQSNTFTFLSEFLRCTQDYFHKYQAKNVTNDCLHAAYVAESAADTRTSPCFLLNPINEVCPVSAAANASVLQCLPNQPRRCRTYSLRERWKLCTCAHRVSHGGGP
jgi:hypothetical protein